MGPIKKIYDAVSIAVPLSEDPNILDILNNSFNVKGHYKRTLATLVQGSLNKDTFGHDDIEDIMVFNDDEFYNSISRLRPVDCNGVKDCPENSNDPTVYKVFSEKPLSDSKMKHLFSSWTKVEIFDWLAYPKYEVEQKVDSFIIKEGVYYNNAIEKAASAMEMSVISAKNVALLIRDFLSDEEKESSSKPHRVDL